MFVVIAAVFVVVQRLEHGLTAAPAHVMAEDGDIPAGRLVVRSAQREQRAANAFFPRKAMRQVMFHIVRQYNGIVDFGAGNMQPCDEVAVR